MRKRNSIKLENGEIQLSNNITNRIDKLHKEKMLLKLCDTEEKRKETIRLAKEDILRQFTRAVISQKHYLTIPCTDYTINKPRERALYGVYKEDIEAQKLKAILKIYSKNIKALTSAKRKLTYSANKLEKKYIFLYCRDFECRNKLFPEIELYLEDLYEKLYTILECKSKKQKPKKKQVEEQLEKRLTIYKNKFNNKGL